MPHGAVGLGVVVSKTPAQACSLPTHPTLPVEGWGIFAVAPFALLVMMAGEIVAASSHLASTNETRELLTEPS